MFWKSENKAENKSQDIIVDLLQEAKCISLTGAWGVGKTHRWENNIKNCFNKNEVIYISGFGKTTLSEFKLELLDKLLKAKCWWSKFLTGFVITAISTFIIGGVIFNIAGGVEDRHWFWITLGVIIGISLLGAIFFYTSLVKYFSNKILGVDHNNIDFKRIWRIGKKPVLCFDDLERSSFDKANCNILSFIEELKKLGYPILLILNPEAKSSEFWKDFKEKVVDRTFEQLPMKKTFDKVISKEERLDDTEKAYLEKIFNIWSETIKNKELVNEKDFDIVFKQIKSNFRLIEAIINNILFVKDKVEDYDKLDVFTKLSLLSYIGLYTVIKFLEISEEQIYTKEEKYISGLEDQEVAKIRQLYNNVVNLVSGSEEPKRFGNMVVIWNSNSFDKLVPVKKLLDSGYIETPIVFADTVSETEKFANSNLFLVRSRTPQIKEFSDELRKRILSEDVPFSSINSMGNILTTLCVCYEWLGKTFDKKDFDWLLPIMDKLIKKESPDLNILIQFSGYLIDINERKGESYKYHAGKYINDIYFRMSIDNVINEIKQSDKFFGEFIHSYTHSNLKYLVYLYVLYIDKQKRKELFGMKNTDYTGYLNVMDYLTVCVNGVGLETYCKKISNNNVDFMPKLKAVLKKDIKSIIKLPNSGFVERKVSNDLLERFD